MDVEEYVRRKVMPILSKVANETTLNRVSVGSAQKRRNFVYYQPHNCRLYFDYVRNSKPTYGGSVVVKNSSELMFKDDFLGCKVTIKKRMVEIINKIDVDKRFIINLDNASSEIKNIISSKVLEGLEVLKELINRFGGSSSFQLMNLVVQDNKIESEHFVDSIPIRAKFRNEVVKKVYSQSNIEFSDPAFACNYLTNQARLTRDWSIDRWASENISCLEDVFSLGGVISLMSETSRLELSNWLFKRFGVGFYG